VNERCVSSSRLLSCIQSAARKLKIFNTNDPIIQSHVRTYMYGLTSARVHQILLFNTFRMMYDNNMKNIKSYCRNRILERNRTILTFLENSIFGNIKKLTLGRILDMFATDTGLSNVRLKFFHIHFYFFSIFFFKWYNASANHPYALSQLSKISFTLPHFFLCNTSLPFTNVLPQHQQHKCI